MKSNKIYIVSAVLFCLGAILVFSGFAASGFDWRKLGVDETYEQKQFDASETVEELVIDDKNLGITIQTGDTKTASVSYAESENYTYKITEDEGKLTIRRHDERQWYDHIGIHFGDDMPKLVVTLPESFRGSIDADTSNGAIRLENITGKRLKLHTSNGKLTLEQVEFAEIDCHTSNGKIAVDEVSGDDISLDTSNGAIKGTIKGSMEDYRITSHTSNGSNNLPESSRGGEKKLYVKTSNGRIDLDFAD